MLCNSSGRETEASCRQPSNANLPIVLTHLGIVTDVRFLHPEKVLSCMLSIWPCTVAESRAVQSSKAFSLIRSMLSGIMMEVRLVHPENAASPM